MNILIMAASLRRDSYNKKLAAVIQNILKTQNHTVTELNFADFLAPFYNADEQDSKGIPQVVSQFAQKMLSHDALILISPEYNYSTPGILKNLIDWISRMRPMPFAKYPIMLASASPAMAGGNRGLLQTLTTLQAACGAYVFPSMFSLSQADKAFTANNQLQDPALVETLSKVLVEFSKFTSKTFVHDKLS
ncbi:MAG: NAD(P)H-dependent oxidoreductase [Gammaproteobacteria bacterium]